MNDPQPFVIALYVAGFAVAGAINLVALWTLLTDEIGRKRRPEDVPDRIDFPAGPGLGGRPRRPAAGHSGTSQSTEVAAPAPPSATRSDASAASARSVQP